MARYFAIINGTTKLPLFFWDAEVFQSAQQLSFDSDDLAQLKAALETVDSLTVVDQNDREAATLGGWDSYSSISYKGRHYSDQLEGEGDELVVKFTKKNLAETVDRLDKQINPVIDFEKMSLDEYKTYVIGEFSKLGEQAIFAGTSVCLLDGTVKNFTYNLEDQSNLLNAMFIIKEMDSLDITIPYHGHTEPCELYSARDILLIYFTLEFFSMRTQTRINMLNSWVRSCNSKAEVSEIKIDSALPQEYEEMAEAILGPTMVLAEELRRKYFPELVQDEPVEEEPSEEEFDS